MITHPAWCKLHTALKNIKYHLTLKKLPIKSLSRAFYQFCLEAQHYSIWHLSSAEKTHLCHVRYWNTLRTHSPAFMNETCVKIWEGFSHNHQNVIHELDCHRGSEKPNGFTSPSALSKRVLLRAAVRSLWLCLLLCWLGCEWCVNNAPLTHPSISRHGCHTYGNSIHGYGLQGMYDDTDSWASQSQWH